MQQFASFGNIFLHSSSGSLEASNVFCSNQERNVKRHQVHIGNKTLSKSSALSEKKSSKSELCKPQKTVKIKMSKMMSEKKKSSLTKSAMLKKSKVISVKKSSKVNPGAYRQSHTSQSEPPLQTHSDQPTDLLRVAELCLRHAHATMAQVRLKNA